MSQEDRVNLEWLCERAEECLETGNLSEAHAVIDAMREAIAQLEEG